MKPQVKFYDFKDMPFEKVDETYSRKFIMGEKGQLTLLHLKKGGVVGPHHHPSEQITYILEGRVLVTTEGREYELGPGDVLVIPSNITHRFDVLEDCVDLDIFSPPRTNWVK